MLAQIYYVYILCNRKKDCLYIGFTNDIRKRTIQHKNGTYDGYTKRYRIDKLVYFEEFYDKSEAVKRERRLKKWNRSWKLELIESKNRDWKDLFGTFQKKLSGVEVLDSLFRGNKLR